MNIYSLRQLLANKFAPTRDIQTCERQARPPRSEPEPMASTGSGDSLERGLPANTGAPFYQVYRVIVLRGQASLQQGIAWCEM